MGPKKQLPVSQLIDRIYTRPLGAGRQICSRMPIPRGAVANDSNLLAEFNPVTMNRHWRYVQDGGIKTEDRYIVLSGQI